MGFPPVGPGRTKALQFSGPPVSAGSFFWRKVQRPDFKIMLKTCITPGKLYNFTSLAVNDSCGISGPPEVSGDPGNRDGLLARFRTCLRPETV